ncbi:hypothetical protein FQZ97_545030 [compost metagenome]
MQHGVGNGADTGLQRQQGIGQAARIDLAPQEGIDVAGDGVGFFIGRQGVGRAVRLVRNDDGGDPGGIHLDERLADALVRGHQPDRLACRPVGGHVDVVQAFDGGGHAQVQFDDDLVRLLRERSGIAHRHRRYDGAALCNRRGLDDGHIDRADVARAQLFDRFRQVLVDEGDFALVDLAAQRRIDLERHAPRQGIGLRQHLVRVVAQRGAGDQRNGERVALGAGRQRRRHRFTVASAGKTAHSDGHAVLNQQSRLFGGRDLGAQPRVADTVEMHGVSRFQGPTAGGGARRCRLCAQAPSDAAFPEVPWPDHAGAGTNFRQYRKARENLVMT